MARIEYHRPQLYPKQLEAIFDPHRFSLIEASTKSGKTSGCIAWLVEEALKGRRGWNYWWVAPVSLQAIIAFRRMKAALPRGSYTTSASLKTITLANGAVVWFKSGDTPDSLYGEDVYAVVVDEASRMKQDAYIAIRTTLTYTKGLIRIIGNVRGRKNWFYEMSRQAQREQTLGIIGREMSWYRITANDAVAAGVLDAKEIEDARGQMPETLWRELYMAEASDDGGNPFGLQFIEACYAPLSAKPPRWWGWDYAKKRDFTVGIGLDEDGAVCRFERFQQPWGETMNRVIGLSRGIPTLADSTGVGDPVVEGIQRTLGETFQGYHFTQGSKQKLMEGLAMAIQTRAVTFPKGVISDELEMFEFVLTRTGVSYSAPPGYHDDCVCALALAQMCRTVVPAPVHVTPDFLARARSLPRTRQH